METGINYNEKINHFMSNGHIEALDIVCRYFDINPINGDPIDLSKVSHIYAYAVKNEINLTTIQRMFYNELVKTFKSYYLITEFKDFNHPIILRCKKCKNVILVNTRYLEHCPCRMKDTTFFIKRYRDTLKLKRTFYEKFTGVELISEMTTTRRENLRNPILFLRDVKTKEVFMEYFLNLPYYYPRYVRPINNYNITSKKDLQNFLNNIYGKNVFNVIKFNPELEDFYNKEYNPRLTNLRISSSEAFINNLYYLDIYSGTRKGKFLYTNTYEKYEYMCINSMEELNFILRSLQFKYNSLYLRSTLFFYQIHQIDRFSGVYIPDGVNNLSYNHEPKLEMPTKSLYNKDEFVLIKHTACGNTFLVSKEDLFRNHKIFPHDRKYGNCCCPFCKNEELYNYFFESNPKVLKDFDYSSSRFYKAIELRNSRNENSKLTISKPRVNEKITIELPKRKTNKKKNGYGKNVLFARGWKSIYDIMNTYRFDNIGRSMTSEEEYIRHLFIDDNIPLGENSSLNDELKLHTMNLSGIIKNDRILSILNSTEFFEETRYMNYISCDGNMSEAFKSLEEVYLHTVEIDPNEYLY